MKNYKLKLDGSADAFNEMSIEQMYYQERNTERVSIKVSKRMLKRMKAIAEIQNEESNDRILYGFVKTMLTLNQR